MATTITLEKSGALVRFEAALRVYEFPDRSLYMAPIFRDWLDGPLYNAPKVRGRPLTPYEQVDEIFTRFVAGRRLYLNSDFNKLNPRPEHVWYMKTPDVRVFGFFHRRRIFIAVCGGLKGDVKGKYKHFLRDVVGFRTALPLNAPKADPTPTEKFHDLL